MTTTTRLAELKKIQKEIYADIETVKTQIKDLTVSLEVNKSYWVEFEKLSNFSCIIHHAIFDAEKLLEKPKQTQQEMDAEAAQLRAELKGLMMN